MSDAEIVEQPPRPALIHAGDVTAVEADARRRDLLAPARGRRVEIAGGVAINRLAGLPNLGDFLPRGHVGGGPTPGRLGVIQFEGILRGRLQRGLKGILDGGHFDSHQHGKRLRRHVVGTLGRTAGIEPQIRIILALEQRLGPARERLVHADHVAPGRVALAVGREWVRGALDLGLAEGQRLEHLFRRARIALRRRDHERVRGAPLHVVPVDFVERAQHVLPARGGLIQ